MSIIESALPVPIMQFLDNNGAVVPGGLLFTYGAGGTVKTTTYTDATGATPAANPVVADANGRLNCWLTPGTAYKLVWCPSTDTDPPTNAFWTVDNVVGVPTYSVPKVCEGRLTLTSGTPVTTSDVTAAQVIYFTPYTGDKVAIYDGTNWNIQTFTEINTTVPVATGMNDIFISMVGSTPTLTTLPWTNTTTRATALIRQNGVLCLTGTLTKRYLGSFYVVASATDDSVSKRNLFNYYNRVWRPLHKEDSTNSWDYSTATLRPANNDATNCIEYVTGVSEDMTHAEVLSMASNSTGGVFLMVGIGVNSTTAHSNTEYSCVVPPAGNKGLTNFATMHARYRAFPAIGWNKLTWLEYSQATVTTTWYGTDSNTPSLNKSGISGEVWA